MKHAVRAAVSFFYLGHAPVAAGTLGSLAGLGIAWFLNPHLPLLTVILCLAGVLLCQPAIRAYQNPDPPQFVLDEVCGMMLSVLWLPVNGWLYVTAFILFRVLDIAKPWPIRWLEERPMASSIMWDDLAAGVATNLFLRGLILFLPQFQP